MTSDKKPAVLVCARVVDMAKAAILGSTPDGVCDACGERVWLSPASKKLSGVTHRCLQCLKATADDVGWHNVSIKFTADQDRELRENMDKGDAP